MSVFIVIIVLLFISCQHKISDEQAEKIMAGARVAFEEENFEKAERLLSKLPGSSEKHLLNGRILASKGNFERALQEYSAVSENDREFYYRALCLSGELEISRGNIGKARKFYTKALDLFPSLSDAHLGMAEVYLESGNPRGALDEILLIEKSSPGGEYIGVLKARAQLGLGKFADAEKTLRKNLDRHPDSVQSYIILARIIGDRGEASTALELLSIARKLGPGEDAKREILQQQAWNYARMGDDEKFDRVIKEISGEYPEPWFAHQLRGQILFSREKWEEATREYEAALGFCPGNMDLHLNLARLYYRMREREKARNHYRKVLEIEPDHLEAIIFLADIAIRERRFEDAREGIKKAEKLGAGESIILSSANLAIEEKDFVKAEKLYREVLGSDPSNENALWGLGRIMLLRGEYGRAERYLKRELETDPDNFSVWVALSEALMAQGREKEAGEAFSVAEEKIRDTLSGMPHNDEAWSTLAKRLISQGKLKAAEEALKKALELRPNFFGPRVGLAYIMLKDGREKQGEELMKKLLVECPGEVEGRHMLAEYYLEKGRYRDALSQAEMARSSLPGDLIAASQMAEALEKLGRHGEAQKFLNEIKKAKENHCFKMNSH
ncbi:MAG: tetratricopeptide repeat protein [Candidatus Eremiobacteraeota bacterium]|nr:tetratricopeptide repeat protein [Candidatus Eremiobacteraeota bacterium]